MVNHRTRIIAVVDNTVIMRYHEYSSHHSRETRTSLDSLKLPLIPGANVQPLLHFALQRPEGSRLQEETVADAAARHYAFSEQHRPSGKDDQVMK